MPATKIIFTWLAAFWLFQPAFDRAIQKVLKKAGAVRLPLDRLKFNDPSIGQIAVLDNKSIGRLDPSAVSDLSRYYQLALDGNRGPHGVRLSYMFSTKKRKLIPSLSAHGIASQFLGDR